MEGEKDESRSENIETDSTCVQQANALLNCLLSSSSINKCEEEYGRFRECCSVQNIVNIKLEGSELGQIARTGANVR